MRSYTHMPIDNLMLHWFADQVLLNTLYKDGLAQPGTITHIRDRANAVYEELERRMERIPEATLYEAIDGRILIQLK